MIGQFKGFKSQKVNSIKFEGYVDVQIDIAERIDVWYYIKKIDLK